MHDQDKIKQFFNLLTESGLDKERIIYWLNRFKNDEFTDKDGVILTQELKDHLTKLDGAIVETEEDIVRKKAVEDKLDSSSISYLEKIAAHQANEYEAEEAEYKNSILGAEKNMSGEIESMRNAKTNDEIAALRKKLSS
jgi:hypothetical protein